LQFAAGDFFVQCPHADPAFALRIPHSQGEFIDHLFRHFVFLLSVRSLAHASIMLAKSGKFLYAFCMKASATVFEDVPARLNQLARKDERQYQPIYQWIATLNEAARVGELVKEAVKRTAIDPHRYLPRPEEPEGSKEAKRRLVTASAQVPRLQGARNTDGYPLTTRQRQKPEPHPEKVAVRGPAPGSLDALLLQIAQRYAAVVHAPAPENETEWKKKLRAPAQLATRIAQLYLSGDWDQLHQCRTCSKWLLARRDAETCSPRCREKRREQRPSVALQRRVWELRSRRVPRIKARLRKLVVAEHAPQRETWQKRLDTYQQELKELEGRKDIPKRKEKL
jgi:hypothetical protein